MKYSEIPDPAIINFASTVSFDNFSEKERFLAVANELSKLRSFITNQPHLSVAIAHAVFDLTYVIVYQKSYY
jgi:hypothetical protein